MIRGQLGSPNLPSLCLPSSLYVATLAGSRAQEETISMSPAGGPPCFDFILWALGESKNHVVLEPFPSPLLLHHGVSGWGLGISTRSLLAGWPTPSPSPQLGRFFLEPQRLRDGFRPAGWMDESSGHLRDLLLAHPNGNHPVGAPGPGLPITGEQSPRGIPGEAHGPVVF